MKKSRKNWLSDLLNPEVEGDECLKMVFSEKESMVAESLEEKQPDKLVSQSVMKEAPRPGLRKGYQTHSPYYYQQSMLNHPYGNPAYQYEHSKGYQNRTNSMYSYSYNYHQQQQHYLGNRQQQHYLRNRQQHQQNREQISKKQLSHYNEGYPGLSSKSLNELSISSESSRDSLDTLIEKPDCVNRLVEKSDSLDTLVGRSISMKIETKGLDGNLSRMNSDSATTTTTITTTATTITATAAIEISSDLSFCNSPHSNLSVIPSPNSVDNNPYRRKNNNNVTKTCSICLSEYSSGNWYRHKDIDCPGYICKSCYVCVNRRMKIQKSTLQKIDIPAAISSVLESRGKRKPRSSCLSMQHQNEKKQNRKECCECFSKSSSGDWYRDHSVEGLGLGLGLLNCQRCYQRKKKLRQSVAAAAALVSVSATLVSVSGGTFD